MHVALDARPLQAGYAGQSAYLSNLVRAVLEVDQGLTVSLFGDRRLPVEPLRSLPEARTRWVSAPVGALWMPLAAPRAARQDRVDVYHAEYMTPPLAACPRVVTIHDVSFMLFPQWFPRRQLAAMKPLIRLSARTASAVITISRSSREDLIRTLRLPPHKVHVTNLAPDHRFTPGDRQAAREFVRRRWCATSPMIVVPGFSSPRKNVSRLLSACRQVERMAGMRPTVLVTGGDGVLTAHQLRARHADWDQRLVFTGHVEVEELAQLYRAADVIAYPSLYEGFGLPVVEAMACGAPVVTSSVSSMPEVAGSAAVLVDPHDTDSIAAGLTSALTDVELRQRLQREGPAQAASFSWRRTAEQTLTLYRQVAGGTG